MLNVKIILIIIGLIIIILGLFNHKKEIIKYKTIYKLLPRDVYDEVFLSYPIQYNKGVFDNMEPEYVVDDESGKFNSIYKSNSNFGDKYDIENTLNTQNLIDYLKYTGVSNYNNISTSVTNSE